MADEPCENTDVEVWRETPGDYYSDSIFVTKSGAVGINVGGLVIVKPLRGWYGLGLPDDIPRSIHEAIGYTPE
mgnify:CR=1 FL=1